MRDITMKQIEAIKGQTFGVEIETSGLSHRKCCEIIAQYFDTMDTVTDMGTYYKIYGCKDRKGRIWKCMHDGSITTTNGVSCEIVTPVLRYDDLNDLQEVARALRRAGAKSNADLQCGVHIHIGADGHDASSIRRLVNLMANHEDMLLSATGFSDCRSRWCHKTDSYFLSELNKQKPKTMAELADVWYDTQAPYASRSDHYNNSRYHTLNLHSTFTKGTLEFRLFEFERANGDRKGGIHAGQLKAYIQLCLALSANAKLSKRVNTTCNSNTVNTNPRYSMHSWLVHMGLIGDEFKTCRSVLTNKLSGDTGFAVPRASEAA